ncbi:MAG: aspartate kinase [Muribaculaceae bacterium]|nr:aspartate kinase [Muribaculaceae bacterium]
MKILKFGGTSVGTVDSLTNVKKIVDSLDQPAIVVVSALGGLTDRLIATARSASEGKEDYIDEMKIISSRHFDIIDALIPPIRKDDIKSAISSLLKELGDIFKGLSLIRSLPERTLDLVVSFGERMSSIIVAGMLNDARHHDSLSFMRTERWFNKDIADRQLTDSLIKKEFPLPLTQHCVMGGFISRDRDTNEITNLGRGGSDYSAALVAAALDADELEIWTDVDGFLTTDPRIVKNVKLIPSMTFVESMELCSFGAKVIYPPTIYPVFHKNIPIRILNTFNPSAPGTFICDGYDGKPRVCGVSSLGNIAVITISGALASNVAEINTRAYNVMSRNGIGVLLVGQPDNGTDFSIAVPASDLDKAVRLFETEFSQELREEDVVSIKGEKDMTIIAVVGEGIKKISGLGPRLVNTLWRNGIEVKSVSDGASETTIAVVVKKDDSGKALSLIYESSIERG